MKVNGEAIYDTKAGPFGLFSWGRCTKKEVGANTSLYFSVFDWPKDGKLSIPGLNNKVASATLLANATGVKTKKTKEGLEIFLPSQAIDPIATVIKVEVKGAVGDEQTKSKDKMKSGELD
jgi:alpha-L-fucosidase